MTPVVEEDGPGTIDNVGLTVVDVEATVVDVVGTMVDVEVDVGPGTTDNVRTGVVDGPTIVDVDWVSAGTIESVCPALVVFAVVAATVVVLTAGVVVVVGTGTRDSVAPGVVELIGNFVVVDGALVVLD